MGIAAVLMSKAPGKVSARILKAELLSDEDESFQLGADDGTNSRRIKFLNPRWPLYLEIAGACRPRVSDP